MPIYTYEDCNGNELDRNVSIAERDNQNCDECSEPLKRKIVFKGLTWAPTAGGMR